MFRCIDPAILFNDASDTLHRPLRQSSLQTSHLTLTKAEVAVLDFADSGVQILRLLLLIFCGSAMASLTTPIIFNCQNRLVTAIVRGARCHQEQVVTLRHHHCWCGLYGSIWPVSRPVNFTVTLLAMKDLIICWCPFGRFAWLNLLFTRNCVARPYLINDQPLYKRRLFDWSDRGSP